MLSSRRLSAELKLGLAVFGAALSLACCPGCGILRPPSNADDVSANWRRFGDYTLHWAGGDVTAWNLVRSQSWTIFQGHRGGQGDTLEVLDPSGCVRLIWAYNSFSGFVLTEGWAGQTVKGARIGTNMSEFRELHPAFEGEDADRLWFQSGILTVIATFEDSELVRISVTDY